MPQSRTLRVIVLLGGETGERPVSIQSGLAVAGALARAGHRVDLLDPATGHKRPLAAGEDVRSAASEFSALQPDARRMLPSLTSLDVAHADVVANLLHGGAGENGQVASVLEFLGVPFFGCRPAAAAVAMDKVLAKRVFRAEGIPVAREFTWGGRGTNGSAGAPGRPPSPPSSAQVEAAGGYPLVVKPIDGGSTLGLTIVRNAGDWEAAWEAGGALADRVRGLLVEEFIPGRELTVGVLDGRSLPIVEIRPKDGFYDFQNKYEKGRTEYDVPARLPEAERTRLEELGLRAFRALECRDLGRTDIRLAPDGRCAVLEVNTVPGMTETSLIPKAAAAAGLSFDELVARLIALALARAEGDRGPERNRGGSRACA